MEERFGQRLKRLRLEQGFSCGELAVKVGVTEGAIRQIESGQSKSASFPVGVRLARLLKIDPYELALGIPASNYTPEETAFEARMRVLEEQLLTVTKMLDTVTQEQSLRKQSEG